MSTIRMRRSTTKRETKLNGSSSKSGKKSPEEKLSGEDLDFKRYINCQYIHINPIRAKSLDQ